MELRRTLAERFLRRNLEKVTGPILEVGPGTGRFSPVILSTGAPTVLLDLSRPMLRAARSHLRRQGLATRPWGYVLGAAEDFRPFHEGSFGAVVIVGLFGFFSHDGERLLGAAFRLLRPGGYLLVEGVGPSNATFEIFPTASANARQIYREPDRFHFWSVIRNGYQPFDPEHFAPWEFRFWRAPQLTRALEREGFEVVERMALAPTLGNQPEALRVYHRDAKAWNTLLLGEEEVGHWEECLGVGPTYLIAARRPRRALGRSGRARRGRRRPVSPRTSRGSGSPRGRGRA